jgi:hypothetical protein
MSQEEQGKKKSEVISNAAAREVIPAEPAVLSDADLDKVAGGITRTWIADDTTTTIQAHPSPTKYTIPK